MLKKTFMSLSILFLLAICILLPAPTSAEIPVFRTEDEVNETFEKFLKTLPQKSDRYKSRQRPLLVSGAMNTEISDFVYALKDPVLYRELNYVYVAGTYKGYPVVVSRTEQNEANAAASTALAIKFFRPVAVINQGTAGGHVPGIHLNDIVIGERTINISAYRTEVQSEGTGIDMTLQKMRGTYAYNKESGIFKRQAEYFPDDTLLNVAKSVADNHKEFTAVVGTISTSNTWYNIIDYINFLHKKYGSTCEEMETCAIAQICQNSDTPFIGIRVISNNITNGEPHEVMTAYTGQKFTLLVMEKYIQDVLKK